MYRMKKGDNIMKVANLIESVKALFANGVGPKVIVIKDGVDAVSNFLGIFLGLMVYAIIIGLPIITALDIVYITMPFLRDRYIKSKNGDETKVRLVSKDATDSIRESMETGGETSALQLYLIKRTKTYVIVGCLLTLIATGMWTIIVGWLINLSSTFISWIMSW